MHEYNLARTAAINASDVVDIATVKRHLLLDHDDQDVDIDRLVRAAVLTVEADAHVALVSGEFELKLPKLPTNAGPIRFPIKPVDLTTAPTVEYLDEDDITLLSYTDFRVDEYHNPVQLVPTAAYWPRTNGALITFHVGASVCDIHPALIQAVLIVIAALFEHRGDEQRTLDLPSEYWRMIRTGGGGLTYLEVMS